MADDTTGETERELAQTQMTFGEHLGELRGRILKSLVASLLGLAVVFIYHEQVFFIVTDPYRTVMEKMQQDAALISAGVTQAFFAHIKVSFIVGLILTAPIWIYQLWMFIGAGLYGRERKLVYKFAPLCLLLFVSGVLFGFFILIPIGLNYLLTFADPAMVRNMITIPEYLRFFTLLTLLLGVAFELPVVMLGLVRAGMVTPAGLREKRKWALVLIFVMAAVFTPPDPVTQVLLAIPLVGLYQLGIFLGWLSLGRSRDPIDWGNTWRVWRKILIAAGLLYLLWNPLTDLWKREQTKGNLYDPTSAEAPPVAAVAHALLDEEVAGAYLVAEESVGGSGEVQQTWVLRATDRCFVAVLVARRVGFQVIDRPLDRQKESWIDFEHFPQRRVMWRMEKPPFANYRDFMPQLLEALRVGDENVRKEARGMLQLLTKQSPAGEDEEALEAFSKWFGEHRDQRLLQ